MKHKNSNNIIDTLEWAKKQLYQGERIRQKDWDNKYYYYLKDNKLCSASLLDIPEEYMNKFPKNWEIWSYETHLQNGPLIQELALIPDIVLYKESIMCYSNCLYENHDGECTLKLNEEYPDDANCIIAYKEQKLEEGDIDASDI